MPKAEKCVNIYGISVLITLFVCLVWEMNGTLMGLPQLIDTLCFIWTSFGIWIWAIWKCNLRRKQKKSTYYKNIEEI